MKIDRVTWYSSTGESIDINRSGIHQLTNKLQTSGITAHAYTTKSYMQHGQTYFNSVYDPVDMELDFMMMKVTETHALATFNGKIAGSTVENPHSVQVRYDNVFPNPTTVNFEYTQDRYDGITTNGDGNYAHPNVRDGRQTMNIFKFNIIAHLERKYSKDIWNGKTSLADKIEIAKQIVGDSTCNVYAFGKSPTGYKASLNIWLSSSNTWYDTPKTTTSNTFTQLSLTTESIADNIDSNGFIYYILYAEPSDGTTLSELFVEYVEFDIVINPDLINTNARKYVNKLFAPHLGTGTLWITLEDGSQYARDCHVEVAPLYPTGFSNDNLRWQNVHVELTADNPFWYTAEKTLTPSSGSFTITNNGDAPTGIRLQFISSNGTCTIKNNTTGEFVKITSVLNLSKIYMNTNQGQEWVENPDGVGAWSTLDPASTLFKIVPGDNSISITGTTPTQINVWYRDRYQGI